MKKIFIIVLSIFVGLSACSSKHLLPGELPEVKPYSEEELKKSEKVNLLFSYFFDEANDKQAKEVINIFSKLVAKLDPKLVETYKPRVKVLLSKDYMNAGSLAGGNCFIWTALLEKLNNKDEIAGVLAHEIGHLVARHFEKTSLDQIVGDLSKSSKNISRNLNRRPRYTIENEYTKNAEVAEFLTQTLAGLAHVAAFKLFIQPKNIENEYQADAIGLLLMAESGFNPESAIKAQEKLGEEEKYQIYSSFSSSHPTSEDRIKKLKDLLPMALEKYEATRR